MEISTAIKKRNGKVTPSNACVMLLFQFFLIHSDVSTIRRPNRKSATIEIATIVLSERDVEVFQIVFTSSPFSLPFPTVRFSFLSAKDTFCQVAQSDNGKIHDSDFRKKFQVFKLFPNDIALCDSINI